MVTEEVEEVIRQNVGEGKLVASAVENIKSWMEADFLPAWARESIVELVEGEAWDELNDRFYKTLAFGTGGMRGRTIGNIVTLRERGKGGQGEVPDHSAVGTNTLNDFNVVRATVGLFRYCEDYLKAQEGRFEEPRLVIAHDVRHFSDHFCKLAASVWGKLGGRAYIFDGPRSTPQLSFSVRYLKTHAGIVITASHNPPHDNGYKVYFEDGGQVVSPHAERIIEAVNAVGLAEISRYLEVDEACMEHLPVSVDEAYLKDIEAGVLDADLLRERRPKVVFTPIHGTGKVAAVPIMERFGVDCVVVEEQMTDDPHFSTVKSPNPENAEALSLAIAQAKACGDVDIVMGTDPDGDRMGVAVPNTEGEMVLLSGNSIGSLLAAYRIAKLKELGYIPEEGTQSAAIIKTFVTTGLQEAIAKAHGLKLINTLTGFKWIGEKLNEYEGKLREALKREEGIVINYNETDRRRRMELLLKYSTFCVFGGEESYGYLASDSVRDKDANSAVIMFCELVAHLKQRGMSVLEYLNALYVEYGYYTELPLSIFYEGAEGASKIRAILESYKKSPPKAFSNVRVKKIRDFGRDALFDADGKRITPQDFYFVELEDGYSYAVRASGTEPKIKFYFFAYEGVETDGQLKGTKLLAKEKLEALRDAVESDAHVRAG